jgi:hypothetical protein
MNVKEMLQKSLREMGADGLCNPDIECGCGIDDLAPGMEGCLNIDECQAAKWVPPNKADPKNEWWPDGYYQVI